MDILFIQTGGTIDKDYPKSKNGYAFEIHDPAFYSICNKVSPSFQYRGISLFKKDSQEITDIERRAILDFIVDQPEKHIIITHGTDTIIDTAQFLSKRINDKTIILTGAMRPSSFSKTDADFNLGGAVAAAQLISSGVYVYMHGIIKKASDITRSEDGKFV